MNKRAVLIVILLIIALILVGARIIISRKSVNAGLKVVSNPVSSVFLDERLEGKTPFEKKYPSGEYVVKLIPDDVATGSSSWQGKVKLLSSVWTYIRRDLGTSELTSAGEVLTLEKIPGSESQISVQSIPEGAMVVLDGQEKEPAPTVLSDIVPGEHDLAVNSPGFISRTVRVQATLGYKVNVNVQLALSKTDDEISISTPSGEVEENKEKTAIPSEKIQVLIKDTPTGFLRVRSAPTTSSTESARVKPGEKFPFLEEKSGWYKILYEQDKEGWISSRYAEKVK